MVFEIQGDSESEYKVADAQDYHGATFGDEVDEEPNLPDWADESTRSFSEISEIEPESELDLVELEEEEQDELEEESDSDMTGDLSVPQVQNFEVEPEEEVEEKSEESDEEEEEPQQPAVITPDVCPVCGSEASVGASSCETCSFQFS